MTETARTDHPRRSAVDDQALLAAVAENHVVWFRQVAAAGGGRTEQVGGAELSVGLTGAMIGFPSAAIDADAVVTRIRSLRCQDVGCWSLGPDPALGTKLIARGFGWGWQPHWMALDLAELPAQPTAAERAHQVGPASAPYARKLPYAPRNPEPEDSLRLGVRRGEATVGRVVVNLHDGIAGIYSMGVAERCRRRGIGLALTLAACRAAAERGCDHAVLNATELGEQLYRRVGFRSLGWGQTWWWCANARPTARQTALAEAIGCGDIGALTALAPEAEELESPLPGHTSPLRLALLTGRLEIARWMLERCPQLAAQRFEPFGGTLLHLAVEGDRPEFIELGLAYGVDPNAPDQTYNGTAAGWAKHFDNRVIAEQLRRG